MQKGNEITGYGNESQLCYQHTSASAVTATTCCTAIMKASVTGTGGALTMSSSNGAGNTVDGEDNSGGLTESLAYLVASKRADISLYSLGEVALRGGGGFNIKGVAGAQWDAPHMEPLLFLVLAQPRKLGYRN